MCNNIYDILVRYITKFNEAMLNIGEDSQEMLQSRSTAKSEQLPMKTIAVANKRW